MKLQNALAVLCVTGFVYGCEGPMGPAGPPGQNGTNGTNGQQGTPGAPGVNGEKGADGAKGDTGATGPAGPTGGIVKQRFCSGTITVAGVPFSYTYERSEFASGDVFSAGSVGYDNDTFTYAASGSGWYRTTATGKAAATVFIDADPILPKDDGSIVTLALNATTNGVTMRINPSTGGSAATGEAPSAHCTDF